MPIAIPASETDCPECGSRRGEHDPSCMTARLLSIEESARELRASIADNSVTFESAANGFLSCLLGVREDLQRTLKRDAELSNPGPLSDLRDSASQTRGTRCAICNRRTSASHMAATHLGRVCTWCRRKLVVAGSG